MVEKGITELPKSLQRLIYWFFVALNLDNLTYHVLSILRRMNLIYFQTMRFKVNIHILMTFDKILQQFFNQKCFQISNVDLIYIKVC